MLKSNEYNWKQNFKSVVQNKKTYKRFCVDIFELSKKNRTNMFREDEFYTFVVEFCQKNICSINELIDILDANEWLNSTMKNWFNIQRSYIDKQKH